MYTRERFIKDYVGMLLKQRDLMGVSQWPKDAQNIYDAGVLVATYVTLSVTDSRMNNISDWRITSRDGEVVSFYPKADAEHVGPDVLGLIVEVQENYRESVAHGYQVSTLQRY